MDVDLLAGVAVSYHQGAESWFYRFFGEAESFKPNDTRARLDRGAECFHRLSR